MWLWTFTLCLIIHFGPPLSSTSFNHLDSLAIRGQFHSMCCRCFCFICAAIHRDAMVFVKKLLTMLLRCVSFVPCSALLQPGSVSFIHSDFQFISAVLISPIPFHPLSISRTTAILFNVVHCCHFASKYLLFVVMMIIIRHSKLIANVFFSLNTY